MWLTSSMDGKGGGGGGGSVFLFSCNITIHPLTVTVCQDRKDGGKGGSIRQKKRRGLASFGSILDVFGMMAPQNLRMPFILKYSTKKKLYVTYILPLHCFHAPSFSFFGE